MPYIDKKRREEIWELAQEPETAGELNFLITKIFNRYLGEGPNYQRFNDVFGVLDLLGRELYERRLKEYEMFKRLTNGDVY